MWNQPDNYGKWWDTAQICLNGHTVTYALVESPQRAQKYCQRCGAPTIEACPTCDASIRGYFHRPDIVDWGFEYTPPARCHNCGQSYPWTNAILEAAKELADLNLDEADAAVVKENLDDIVRDTPRTKVAALKVMKAFSKAGPTVMGMFRDIVVDVASETAKKVLLGQ